MARKASGKRAERRALRTEEILQTAWELLEEGGLDAVTTTEIARRNGAALGALYRFFPSKAAVIAALQRQALAALLVDLERAVATALAAALPEPERSLAGLLALADAFLAEPARAPARFRLVDEVLSRPGAFFEDEEARAVEEAVAPILALAERLSEDAARGLGREVDDEVRRFPYALWAGLHGVTHFVKRDRLLPPRLASSPVARTMVTLLVRGLGASEEQVARARAVLAAPSAR